MGGIVKFKGKIGCLWILILLYVNGILIGVIPAVQTLLGCLTVIILLIVADIFLFGWTFKNYVLLFDDHFVLYFGYSKKIVKYSEIISVQKTRSAIAGTALSLDRIMILTETDSLVISLKHNDAFIESLKKISQKHNLSV